MRFRYLLTLLGAVALAITGTYFVVRDIDEGGPISRALGMAPPPLVFYGTVSDALTIDADATGGNPFATALIETLGRPSLELSELSTSLVELTAQYSGGYQTADVPQISTSRDRSILPATRGQRRMALIVIVSAYLGGYARALPGAKFDALRLKEAFEKAGFETELVLDESLPVMRSRIAQFGTASKAADVALIYLTGHGVQVDGVPYLVPADYPFSEKDRALHQRALMLSEAIASPAARTLNLVFYGACRENPFKSKKSGLGVRP